MNISVTVYTNPTPNTMDKQNNEIKVKHHSTNTGFCQEYWQGQSSTGKTIWLVRDTMDGHWRFLSSSPDEDGEPDTRIPDNIEIVICNSDWVEYYRTGNDKTRFPDGFPTFQKVCQKHWNTIKDKHLPTVGTPELYHFLEEVKPDNLSYLDSINWGYNYYHNIDPEFFLEDGIRVSREDKADFKTTFLLKFDYMGKQYHIARIAQHHSMCNARWYEYKVVSLTDGKINGTMHWFGYGLISNK